MTISDEIDVYRDAYENRSFLSTKFLISIYPTLSDDLYHSLKTPQKGRKEGEGGRSKSVARWKKKETPLKQSSFVFLWSFWFCSVRGAIPQPVWQSKERP
ncbi:uncharacterized protein ALTATR162_LOCUS7757 [Alternaria atra]|uniref:Uncharacterized protein n=1 Tax=Alternaria atra TaxID=119953 RepID=A0A8J2I6K8_9PLEO|nr:uncharacterized protein ALTATR162_LOCUS7757 [Alternaria atra]CAG5174285.1 unnamed protein product [Alternaria atra]